MPDVSNQEQRPTQGVSVRTALRTDAVATTPQELQAAEIAKKAIEITTEADTHKEAGFLEPILTDDEAAKAIRARFTGERFNTGQLKDTRDRALENKSITTDKLLRKLAKDGYGGITDAGDKALIVSHFDQMFDLQPELNKLYPKGTPGRQAYIEAWLRDPNNTEYFQELARGAKKEIEGASSEETEQLRKGIARAEEERSKSVTERNDLIVEQQNSTTAIETFDLDPSTGTVVVEALNNDITAREHDIRVKGTQLAVLREELQLLKDRLETASSTGLVGPTGAPLVSPDVAKDKTRQNQIMVQIRTLEIQKVGREDELRLITKQKEDILAKRTKLTEHDDGVTAAVKAKNDDISEIEKAISEANHELILKIGGSESLPDRLEDVIGGAFKNVIEKRLAGEEEVIKGVYREKINQETDKAKQAIKTELLERYYLETTTGMLRKRDTRGYNERNIRGDYGKFLTDGPEVVMVEMLEAGGFTPAEIAERMQNKSFVEEMRPQVVERVLTLRAKTGQISEEESSYIICSEWGGKDIVEKALANNKEFTAVLGKFKEQGLIEDTTLSAIKRADKSTLLAILALLFGGTAVAVSRAMKG